MAPLVLPGLAFGLAALMYFTLLGFRPSLELLIVGHLIVVTPFMLRTVGASLSQLDPALLDASASLGAGRIYTFRRVTLPLIAPGIAAGAFLAFMASVDNVPVSPVPLLGAHGHAADPDVGHDGEHARRARRRRLRHVDHGRLRADAGDGAADRADPPDARISGPADDAPDRRSR